MNPTYTLCLYHGKEKWNGPRCLKDMMDFGEDGEEWERLFSDYQMHLVCLNELEDPAYQKMDEETANIANVMIGGSRIVAKKEENWDDYDMCDGLKGIIEDSINEEKIAGRIEGKIEGEIAGRMPGIMRSSIGVKRKSMLNPMEDDGLKESYPENERSNNDPCTLRAL